MISSYQITSKSLISRIVIMIALFMLVIEARQLELPIAEEPLLLELKAGQQYYFDIPETGLSEVRSRSVRKVKNQSDFLYDKCSPVPPEITLNITDTIDFKGVPERPLLLYKFQDIQYSKNVLDAYYDESEIFVFFEDGTVIYTEISDDLTFEYQTTIQAPSDQKIAEGYFIKMGEKLIFVSESSAFEVSKEKVKKLEGYESEENFQTAISINQKYFGVVYQHVIKLYSADGNKLQVVDQYEAENSTEQSFRDMVYYKEKDALIFSDIYSGILQFDVDVNSHDPILQKKETPLYQAIYCEIMNINQQRKILNAMCEVIYELDLSEWPKVERKDYHFRPDVRTKELYSFEQITAFIGVDAVEFLYWGKKAAYYEDKNLDRLILNDKMFILVNQNSMQIGNYSASPQHFQCDLTSVTTEGVFQLIFVTKSACSNEINQRYSIRFPKLTQNEQYVCIYSVRQKIVVWKEGFIMMKGIKISLFILVIVVVLVFGVVMVRRLVLKRKQNYYMVEAGLLGNSHKQKYGIESGKPIELNEQMDCYESKQKLDHQQEVRKKEVDAEKVEGFEIS